MASSFNEERANQLEQEGRDLADLGRAEAALQRYHQVLTLEPDRPSTLYNIGLVHKYRAEWEQSYTFNLRAYRHRPDDEATRWNLAIAATALRDWDTARRMWHACGIKLDGQSGPISMKGGWSPVRLNPDRDGEVVWGYSLDPVRVVIRNVPLPESGFRYEDVVLHDGAPTGSRIVDGREYAVFNVLDLFQPSAWSTYRVAVHAPTAETLRSLEEMAQAVNLGFEDWTTSLRNLCRACSEGTPHEHTNESTAWTSHRQIGLSAIEREQIDNLLEAWISRYGGQVEEVSLALQAQPGHEKHE